MIESASSPSTLQNTANLCNIYIILRFICVFVCVSLSHSVVLNENNVDNHKAHNVVVSSKSMSL